MRAQQNVHPLTATQPAQPSDPLMVMARAANDAHSQLENHGAKALAARKAGDKSAKIYYENAEKDAWRRYEAIRDSLSCFTAQNLAGAMIQISTASCELDFLFQSLPEEAMTYEVRKLHSSIVRHLDSALLAVEKSEGQTLEELGFQMIGNRHCNNWIDVDIRLAAVKARK